MNPRVLRRFIFLMGTMLALGVVLFLVFGSQLGSESGDYETRLGDQRLEDGLYDKALAHFDKALSESPNHRGALMGRALVFIQTEAYGEAIAELDHLIGFLGKTLEEDDLTGRGALAAAHANRGIVKDRIGRYEEALADYVVALRIDEETVEGPGVIYKILRPSLDPTTVRQRAEYLLEQLALPEEERLLRVPELDDQQPMYKP